ncbi:phenoloxidase 2-like [Contarinia nasturtii]|uniref:phenoloxidase 2-like n=1 Tax=Contarinia nasturtii TaxID=265458 RepID=UPI0012D49B4F|nr:phenoloxidase 2-like [Contarinia nasturtii]
MPLDFYTDRYKTIGVNVRTRFDDNVERYVNLRSVQHPNLDFTKPVKRRGPFSLFNQNHQKIAGQLIQILMDASERDFVSLSAYIKDRVNPYLFLYALAIAVQHRRETQHIALPSIVQQFPDQFVDSSVFPEAREEGTIVPSASRIPIQIELNFTGSERDQEQRLAYFREDIGVNMHHWHWHLIYPAEGPMNIVAKDRRGELFYHMHNQLLARYNTERSCNNLEHVKSLGNLRERVLEGYFSKIVRSLSNRAYPARPDGAILKDINRDDQIVEIVQLEQLRDRIYQAIDQGYVIEYGTNRHIPLNDEKGIDVLGNILESSAISPNRQLYGSLHNSGHVVIAFVHDPENKHLEDYGVMGDVTTAMRDPVFYRWHAFINSMCIKLKNTLQPYFYNDLMYQDIHVISIGVQITTNVPNARPNVLLTYWQKSDVDLGAGLDFGPGNVYAQFTHLQHAPFEYRINVINEAHTIKYGTCRIFLIPKFNERDQPLTYQEQRLSAIEMDKFVVACMYK